MSSKTETKTSLPIRHVLPYLPDVLRTVAPEKFDALVKETVGLKFEVLEHPEWLCHYVPATKTIQFSTRVLELLWACSHAYFVVFDEIRKRKLAGELGVVAIDLGSDPRLKGAAELLRWAMEDFANLDMSQWPSGVPAPVANPAKGSDENVADELALCGAGFLLHHELAHHRLRHQGGEDNAEQEQDADNTSVDWILSGLAHNDPQFIKRSLGVVVATTLMAARGIHTGKYGGKSHPRSFDRVLNALDRRGIKGDHLAWAFAVAALKLHLDNSQITVPQPPEGFEDFRAAVDAYVEALAEDAEGRSKGA